MKVPTYLTIEILASVSFMVTSAYVSSLPAALRIFQFVFGCVLLTASLVTLHRISDNMTMNAYHRRMQ